ncbi:MAG TPA: Panacea domain-containing protein [Flavobacteriaceae bacterium]|nr:Panacea domain-containing protein [Flavobacteriaceae bacterium]
MVELCPDLERDYSAKLIKKTEKLITKKWRSRSEDELKAYFLGEDLANRFTGYRLPDLKKFMGMVTFFAQQLEPFKTKMNKLLLYADFLNYKNSGYSISGIRYQAIQMGPVPRKYHSIYEYMADKKLLDVESVRFPRYTGVQFVMNKEQPFNADLFDKEELNVMNRVVDVFRDNNASEISDISHKEQAWIQNEGGKNLINYNLAFELTEL